MRLFQTQAESASTLMRWRWTVWCSCIIGVSTWLAPQANADFLGPYSLGNFTLLNQNADGTAVTMDGGLSVILTGGNTGSGLQGSTDLFITAAATGTVHFQYSYFSLDDPSFDAAGYLIDGLFTQLTDTSGDSGVTDFPIVAGHSFGFRVATLDNIGEPGVLTISDFSAPDPHSGGTPAPEPGAWPLVLVLSAAFALWRRKEAIR
jgi:hypothetical protein